MNRLLIKNRKPYETFPFHPYFPLFPFLLYLCLAKWRWFILSLVVTLGIATYYTLTTPNVYQRTASLMIKDESKSQSISSDVASMFSDMGMGNMKSNVYNELIANQSPAVLLETGKRLKLDVDYAIDGTFHKQE